MNIATRLTDQFNQLPKDAQLQVLDFVEFLSQKNVTKDSLKLSSEERRSLEKCLGVSPNDHTHTQREAILVK